MTHLTQLQAKKDGFTIVELVVVIAVIGILALIVLVAYPGYQQRTRDNERKSDVQQIASAIGAYAIQKNHYVETVDGVKSGCGVYGDGNGWMSVNAAANAIYQSSIVECLQSAKVLKDGDFIDPSGCLSDTGGACGSWDGQPAKAYMKATCTKGGVKTTYVYAHIESMARNDAAIDALCDANTMTGFTSDGQRWGTHYGMNYYVTVK